MKYCKQEVIQFVEEEDVKFIRLAFCDVFGRQKNISIMPEELEKAFDFGIAIDASAIRGFGDETQSDLFLHPDADTLMFLPWRPEHGRVVRMFCSITYPDGTPFEYDPRYILKKTVDEAEKAGYNFYFGTEMEFYLFYLDENGKKTKIPYDEAGYMDIAPDDKGENVRREICLTLRQMGIIPETSHHEEGPGQNEIDFRYSDALSAADNAMTFRTVVNAVALRNGLWVDFSPRPLENQPGNGLHINLSAKGGNEDISTHVIAGVLEKVPEITLFLNPTAESYDRLGSHKAPGYISWSYENRSQLIRIPAAYGEYKRMELRSPDPTSNPYIAFALLIKAALYGIENKLELEEASDINFFKADKETLSKFKKLPSSKQEAIERARLSKFVSNCLPENIIKAYCE